MARLICSLLFTSILPVYLIFYFISLIYFFSSVTLYILIPILLPFHLWEYWYISYYPVSSFRLIHSWSHSFFELVTYSFTRHPAHLTCLAPHPCRVISLVLYLTAVSLFLLSSAYPLSSHLTCLALNSCRLIFLVSHLTLVGLFLFHRPLSPAYFSFTALLHRLIFYTNAPVFITFRLSRPVSPFVIPFSYSPN